MVGWFLAVVAAVAVWNVVVPRGAPRRFPEDADPPRSMSSHGVVDRGRSVQIGRAPRARRRPIRRPAPSAVSGNVRRNVAKGSGHGTRSEIPSDLATSCDLLVIAAVSGCTVAESVALVGSAGSGPVAAALSRAAGSVADGQLLADALRPIVDDLGPATQPLVTTLVTAVSSGAPVAPALLRLADAERRRGRRLVEARIRRLPVVLLLPLVACILPAFVALTLVPLALSAAQDLELPHPPPSPAGPAPVTFPSTPVVTASRTDVVTHTSRG